MALTYSITFLLGRAGKDAEVRVVGKKDTNLAKFSMATDTDKLLTWHNIQAWGPLAEIAAKVQKGDLVEVRGRIAHSKVGEKTYSCINADFIMICKKASTFVEEPREFAEEGEEEVRPPQTNDELPF